MHALQVRIKLTQTKSASLVTINSLILRKPDPYQLNPQLQSQLCSVRFRTWGYVQKRRDFGLWNMNFDSSSSAKMYISDMSSYVCFNFLNSFRPDMNSQRKKSINYVRYVMFNYFYCIVCDFCCWKENALRYKGRLKIMMPVSKAEISAVMFLLCFSI